MFSIPDHYIIYLMFNGYDYRAASIPVRGPRERHVEIW